MIQAPVGKPVSFKDYDPGDPEWNKYTHQSGPYNISETYTYMNEFVGTRIRNRRTCRIVSSELAPSRPWV